MLLGALSRRGFSRGAVIAAVLASAGGGLSSCGTGSAASTAAGGSQPGAGAAYPVRITTASFPSAQHLAQVAQLVIAVRNIGTATLPNVAVTITDPPWGTAAAAFSSLIAPQSGLASRSRPIWIIDRPPGPCAYNCRAGGAGGAVTAEANTWALGALAPGRAAMFVWTVTAVEPGTYAVAYRVAAQLRPGRPAVLPGGRAAAGELKVRVAKQPRQEYVNASGQVVYGP
jgi:hypothetical protein